MKNDDLISRRAAINEILECCSSDCDNEYECGYDDGLRQAVYRIKHLPSAQPEIIRCKDCKHFDADINHCKVWKQLVYKLLDFCSRAERRTDGKH